MRQTKPVGHRVSHRRTAVERRQDNRMQASFGLMYSALDGAAVVMGDGTVADLSRGGLGIRGNHPVKPGMDMTLFLYVPDGGDPLFVLEASVAWAHGRQFGVQFKQLSLREGKRLQAFLLARRGH